MRVTEKDLEAYRGMKMEAAELREIIDEIAAAIYSPGVKMDGQPRAKGGKGGGMEELVARKDQAVKDYEAKISVLLRDMRRIERGIARLPSVERRILRRHYLSGQTWEAVAEAENYSYVQIWRIKKRALERLAKDGIVRNKQKA